MPRNSETKTSKPTPRKQPVKKSTEPAQKPAPVARKPKQVAPDNDEATPKRAARTQSKPIDVPKRLTPKQKNDALKLKLQALLDEI